VQHLEAFNDVPVRSGLTRTSNASTQTPTRFAVGRMHVKEFVGKDLPHPLFVSSATMLRPRKDDDDDADDGVRGFTFLPVEFMWFILLHCL
jgi:hypothetical protein